MVQCAPLDTIVRAQVMEIWIFGFPIFSLCCELIDIGDKWHKPEKNKKLSCNHLILKVKTCYFQTKCMVKRMKWIIWQLVQSRKFLQNFQPGDLKNRFFDQKNLSWFQIIEKQGLLCLKWSLRFFLIKILAFWHKGLLRSSASTPSTRPKSFIFYFFWLKNVVEPLGNTSVMLLFNSPATFLGEL